VGFQDNEPNGILLFKGADLSYVGRALLPSGIEDGGWVAVDKDGYIYTSPDNLTSIQKYSLSWNQAQSMAQGDLSLKAESDMQVVDENGDPLNLGLMAGGVFSPSGDFVYIVTGGMVLDCINGVAIDEDWMRANGGIHVLDTTSQPWRRIKKSTNGSGSFDYNFEPDLSGGCDEPEGITVWDLDDGRAPGIRGQLHVFMLDNDIDQDDATLYHYTNTIYVNSSYTGEETGEIHKPFNTVGKANNMAWNGSRIKIQAGSYPEVLTFSKQIQVLAQGGTVHIGSAN
jgi:hypothetical protein